MQIYGKKLPKGNEKTVDLSFSPEWKQAAADNLKIRQLELLPHVKEKWVSEGHGGHDGSFDDLFK